MIKEGYKRGNPEEETRFSEENISSEVSNTSIAIRVRNKLKTLNLVNGVDVQKYMRIIERIAGKMAKNPNEFDDLVGAGGIGLADALSRIGSADVDYDQQQYHSFILTRINGAMIDFLRSNSPHSREQAKQLKAIDKAENSIRHRKGRSLRDTVSDEEIAEEMGKTVEEVRELKLNKNRGYLVPDDSLEAQARMTSEDFSDESMEAKKIIEMLFETMGEILNEKEQVVIRMYILKDLGPREIAPQIGVTESRVTQIKQKALEKLRKYLSSKGIEELPF